MRLESVLLIILKIVVRSVAEIPNCQTLAKVIGCAATGVVAFNSLLFLMRICAIFNSQKPVKMFFIALWLGTVACSVTAPFSISAAHIGTTRFCVPSPVARYGSAGVVAVCVNDTLVCATISMKLVLNARALGDSGLTRARLSRGGMGRITQVLLQGGLQYYL